jgi:hypothetical protein
MAQVCVIARFCTCCNPEWIEFQHCLFGILFYNSLLSNDENVEGATHKHVVELIRSGGHKLSLVVLSLPPSEVRKLDPPEDGQAPEYFDYSDKKQIFVTIPETRQIENGREKYAVRVNSIVYVSVSYFTKS